MRVPTKCPNCGFESKPVTSPSYVMIGSRCVLCGGTIRQHATGCTACWYCDSCDNQGCNNLL